MVQGVLAFAAQTVAAGVSDSLLDDEFSADQSGQGVFEGVPGEVGLVHYSGWLVDALADGFEDVEIHFESRPFQHMSST